MRRRRWLLPVVIAVGALLLLTRSERVLRRLQGAVSKSGRAAAAQVPAAAPQTARAGDPAVLAVTVLRRYPHDPTAFTQGLLWHEGKLYETTGQYGQSRLRRIDLDTGTIEREVRLGDEFFGEGLALIPDRGAGDRTELLWLTWRAGRAFRFDLETFASAGELAYQGEGWGLCSWNGSLYRSDGTATLWRHEPAGFAVRERLQVTRQGDPVGYLNELECTPEGILANIWQSDEIVRIDPRSGKVTATLDASGLLPRASRRREAVLNGIAFRPETDTYLLTGKLWAEIFEVALDAQP